MQWQQQHAAGASVSWAGAGQDDGGDDANNMADDQNGHVSGVGDTEPSTEAASALATVQVSSVTDDEALAWLQRGLDEQAAVGVGTVEIMHCLLQHAPPELLQARATLHTLRLDWNALNSVPPVLTQLPSLSSLSLDGNQVTQFPSDVGHLTQLTHLSLRANYMVAVPAGVMALSSLQLLDLQANRLTCLPDDIGDALPLLHALDLASNSIHALPQSMSRLACLEELRVDGNAPLRSSGLVPLAPLHTLRLLMLTKCQQVRLLPDLRRLTSLQFLDAGECDLTAVPSAVSTLSRLDTLVLSRNHLATLPQFLPGALTRLAVSHNRLTSLPLRAPTSLREWDVSANKLTSLPSTWLDQGRCRCSRNRWNVREDLATGRLPRCQPVSPVQVSLLHSAGNQVLNRYAGMPPRSVLAELPVDLIDLLHTAVACQCSGSDQHCCDGYTTRLFLGPAAEAVRVAFIPTLGNFAARVPSSYHLRPGCAAGFPLQ